MSFKRAISAFVAAMCIVSVATSPCTALTEPAVSQVSSLEEFLTLAREQSRAETLLECVAPKPLLCQGSVLFGETVGRVDLTAFFGIRVPAGAVLTIDNPNLVVMGFPPTITVETGGTLRILRWHPLTLEALPTKGIRLEEGALLELSPDIVLPERVVQDCNPTPTPTPELTPTPEPSSEPTPSPTPEPTPEPIPIPTPTTEPPQLECTQWQVRPNGITTIWLKTEPCGLTEEDVTEMRLYRSTDGENWDLRATLFWDAENYYFVTAMDEELYTGRLIGGKVTLQYYEPTGAEPLYLYIEVVTSTGSVVSQPCCFVPPDTAPPPPFGGNSNGGTITGGPGDDDSSSGDRGGVQGEFDRPGQQTQENNQAEQVSPPPTETQEPSTESEQKVPEPKEPVSENEQLSQSETETPADNYVQLEAIIEDTSVPAWAVTLDAYFRRTDPDKVTDGRYTESGSATDAADTTREEQTAAYTLTQDGDRGAAAIAATLAVCGLAAVLLTGRKFYRRRKS